MAIRFACAQCFKVHRVPDRCAGLPGRCGRCGYRFVAPGTPQPGSSPIFIPAAMPNLYPAGRRRRRDGAGPAILAGLMVAGLVVSALFSFRDRIIAVAPGLAPLIPPKSVAPLRPPAVPAPVHTPAPASGADRVDWVITLASVVAGVAILATIAALLLAPLIVPPILSRRGYLSVGRWLIFAGLAFFLLSLATGIAWVEGRDAWGNWTLRRADSHSLAALPCICAVIGCLVAAAIHPKEPPQGRP